MNTGIIAQHMGALHAYEQAIVAGIAFGPFVILAVVIAVVRRRDLAEEAAEAAESGPATSAE